MMAVLVTVLGSTTLTPTLTCWCSHLAKVGFTLNLLLMVARSSCDSATSPGSGDSAGGEQLPASSRGSDTSDTRAPPRPASTWPGEYSLSCAFSWDNLEGK